MVKIGLQIKAQMENCTALAPEGEDFRWYLKLRYLGRRTVLFIAHP